MAGNQYRDERGILDTSVIIDLETIDDPAQLPREPLVSAITLAELSVGPLVADDELERARRQLRVQAVESSFVPLPFDTAAARAFGSVAASLRANGRKPAARAYDALIAASALARQLPIYTRNREDFEGIADLVVRDVHAGRPDP